MRDLTDLTGRWWDWQVDVWDGSGLRLIADNDLTYHHSLTVTFIDVVWVAVADLFHHPVFRPPTPAEGEFARQVAGAETCTLFAWDAETVAATVPMLVVARSVEIVEAVVLH